MYIQPGTFYGLIGTIKSILEPSGKFEVFYDCPLAKKLFSEDGYSDFETKTRIRKLTKLEQVILEEK